MSGESKRERGIDVFVLEKELYREGMISMWFPACAADRPVMRRHDFARRR